MALSRRYQFKNESLLESSVGFCVSKCTEIVYLNILVSIKRKDYVAKTILQKTKEKECSTCFMMPLA